jgi:tetratricopeptide (TPR) repeat protein
MGLIDKLFGKKDAAAPAVSKGTGNKEPTNREPENEDLRAIVPESSAPASTPIAEVQALIGTAMPSPVATPISQPVSETPEPLTTGGGPVLVETPDRGLTEESQPGQMTVEQMRNDPNFVRVYDQYGQEVFLTRQQWREEILPVSLQANWEAPDELYTILLNAMNDGMFAEIEPAAARLHSIDTNPVRGACVYAIVLLQLGRTGEAERVLNDYVERFGEEGAVLTNLAKLYASRNEAQRAEETLWRAIELDPNIENGLGWFLATEFERGGEEGRMRAMERVAALPNSWRVRLWLAKVALGTNDLPRALALYREGLASFPGPVPTEFLYPMSGDLGMAGHLRELIETTGPRFLPEIHGLIVGNNLIKAHVDLAEFEPASAIVSRLFAMKRPDWRETLGFWENTIARLRHASTPRAPQLPLEIGMLEMIGPVWKRSGGPLTGVFGDKPENAPVVTILGGTADFTPPEGPQAMQLADALGRLSRALPLFLAEQLEFHTAARVRTLIPRVTQGGAGFVLRGGEWNDSEAMESAFEAELTPDFVVKAHLIATGDQWILQATVLRASDSASIGRVQAAAPPGQPETAVLPLARDVMRLLAEHGLAAEAPSPLYQLPEGPALANYMIRLEQLLAVRSAITAEDESPAITGERDILEGTLFLALQQPQSPAVRALLASMVVAMRRIRPEIVEEFKDRLTMLQRDQPLGEPLDEIVADMVTDD